jgi:mono/diheme cytochrome c family protein
MKTVTSIAVAVFWASGSGAAHAQSPTTIAIGAATFHHTCAPCHDSGPGINGVKVKPAVAALQMKYHGQEPALIEHRTDLPYSALKAIVRNGTVAMPPFRPTEITDAQIAAVAAYLADTAQKWIADGKPVGP